MSTLLEVLQQADARKFAVGHFNVSDLVTLHGIVEAARQRGLPVVVGASEAERRFIGVRQLVSIVKSLRDEGGPPIFLNADHTHSMSAALEAAKAGFDWVVCDFSSARPPRLTCAERPESRNLRRPSRPKLTTRSPW